MLCADGQWRSTCYQCPQCKMLVSDMPSVCGTCNLMLVESPQLAMTYHHLFPVAPFVEVEPEPCDVDPEKGTVHTQACYSCLVSLPASSSLRLKCEACNHVFCLECDFLIHESLHNCPGCLVQGSTP